MCLAHLESDDGVVEVEGEKRLPQLAEERLQDDCRDVHVAVLEHDLLAAVDFTLREHKCLLIKLEWNMYNTYM